MNKKKIVAPVIITALIVVYYVFFIFLLTISSGIPLLVRIIGVAVPAVLAGVCIYVLIERIKEIRSGEEDDLSKY